VETIEGAHGTLHKERNTDFMLSTPAAKDASGGELEFNKIAEESRARARQRRFGAGAGGGRRQSFRVRCRWPEQRCGDQVELDTNLAWQPGSAQFVQAVDAVNSQLL